MVHIPVRPLNIAGTWLAIRPIHKDDANRLQAFVTSLSDESRYYRFLDAMRELPQPMLRSFVEVDFERDMALVIVERSGEVDENIIAVGRYFGEDEGKSCEFAIAVADAWQKHGLGHLLMQDLLECAASHGYARIYGDVMNENSHMLHLMQSLGFRVRPCLEDPHLRVVERTV